MENKYAKALGAAQRLERQGHYGPDNFFDADEAWRQNPHIKRFNRAVAAADLPGVMDNIRARRAAGQERRKAEANARANRNAEKHQEEIREIKLKITSLERAIEYKKEDLKDEPSNTAEHMTIKDLIYNYMEDVKTLKNRLKELEPKVTSGGRTRRARKRKSMKRGRR